MSEGRTIEFSLIRAKADFFPATLEMMWSSRRIVLYLCAAVVVLTTVFVGSIYNGDPAMLGVAGATFIGMSLYCALIWVMFCYVVARRGFSAPGALAETKYAFSDDGIAGQAENIQSNTAWTYWKSTFETSRNLHIVSHIGQWMFFPKHALSPQTLADLRELVRVKLKSTR